MTTGWLGDTVQAQLRPVSFFSSKIDLGRISRATCPPTSETGKLFPLSEREKPSIKARGPHGAHLSACISSINAAVPRRCVHFGRGAPTLTRQGPVSVDSAVLKFLCCSKTHQTASQRHRKAFFLRDKRSVPTVWAPLAQNHALFPDWKTFYRRSTHR